MTKPYHIKKLTHERWLNLYDVEYQRNTMHQPHHWLMCSRKEKPVADAVQPDAVVIVPILKTPDGNRLVLTKEFRVPIWDGEYGFPAGLIDENETIESTVKRELKEETGLNVVKIHHVSMPVYSSAGLSDESCCMVLVEVSGTPSTQLNEEHEDINVILMDIHDIRQLLTSDKKIAAKAWGLLYCFAVIGKIEFSDSF